MDATPGLFLTFMLTATFLFPLSVVTLSTTKDGDVSFALIVNGCIKKTPITSNTVKRSEIVGLYFFIIINLVLYYHNGLSLNSPLQKYYLLMYLTHFLTFVMDSDGAFVLIDSLTSVVDSFASVFWK